MSVEEATAPADAICEHLVATLRSELGDRVLASEIQQREIVVRVPSSAWVDAVRCCRERLGLDSFCFLSGMDWLDNPIQTTRYENIWGSVDDDDDAVGAEGDDADSDVPEPVPVEAVPAEAVQAEAAEPVAIAGRRTGLAGGESRFQVFARFASTKQHRGITLKADLDDTDPRVPTISKVYPGADWHERETWEMFGFWFDGHPNLIHIYLPGGFEGYPLRKDFPLLAREVKPWPGLTNVEPITGDAVTEEASA